ncbi:PilZ domain-containing protein [bacterium]|nr:PilZ domain-containing protein [bacterium]
MGIERRINDRVDAVFSVSYDSFNHFYTDYTVNISKGGTFIITEQQFKIGDIIRIYLSFPKIVDPIPIDAEVVWTSEDSFDGVTQRGVGVQFIFNNDYHRKKFEKLIHFLLKNNFDENKEHNIFKVLFFHTNSYISETISSFFIKMNSFPEYKNNELIIRTVQKEENLIAMFLNEKFDLVILGGENREFNPFYYLSEFRKHDDLIPYIGLDINQNNNTISFDMVMKKPYVFSKIKSLIDTYAKMKKY